MQGVRKAGRKFLHCIMLRAIEVAVLLVALAIIGVLTVYFWNFGGVLSSRQDVWGQFGDFVGGTLNPLLGFISVLVLVVTLNLQRIELRESRATARDNNRILEEQLRSMHLQSLENTFFKLVEEFKTNEVIQKISSFDSIEGLRVAVFSYTDYQKEHWAKADTKEKNAFFRRMSQGAMNYGELRHVLLDRVIALVEICSGFQNKQIHLALIQTLVGPRLLVTLAHLTKHEMPEKYEILVSGKRILKGANFNLFFADEVARDFLDEQVYEQYSALKDKNRERLIEVVLK